ncbi:hypothetical protein P170DRAFT_421597 [Aspergillus steynii IBT 23096]|uniref:Uncharacterized protein n=1 Tax=Aspergillus steynii IBT 23096 TaxID=1392250 RepID=A0A2I2GQ09_9EURO|nr:uncharacterized protein P170DRAFT_421597 [Aspergillus steynii IBT 23096]PLB54968.1 hypothetical protein P170DRAFT_421597 [Aspergillus steynii IBT 23096]
MLAAMVAATLLIDKSFGAATKTNHKRLNISTTDSHGNLSWHHHESPPGDFPVCTDVNGSFAPFCLPKDGADVLVDATYYVTWNADFYPLNATITIELRYSNSTAGDSAFTSERTDNSYGYTPVHVLEEWLQGKSQNALTLYIIELDLESDRRASVQQGPTVILRRKPVEHWQPSPQLPFNRIALYVGLPVSLAVVVAVVLGLFFGMRNRRKIGIGNIMGSGGYGVGKSRDQRMGQSKGESESDSPPHWKQFTDDVDSGLPAINQSAAFDDLERTASYAFNRDHSKFKSWKN